MPTIQKLYRLNWKQLLRNSCTQFVEDGIPDHSAMLAFYFLLALFPLLLILIPMMGLFIQSHYAEQAVQRYINGVIPGPAAELINRTLGEIYRDSGTFRFSFAVLFLWWSASQGVLATIQGLNIAYGVREQRPWWKKYFVASILTVVTMGLIIFGLLVLSYGGRFSAFLIRQIGFSGFIGEVWQLLGWALFLLLAFVVFNIFYVYAPSVRHRRWNWLMPGTVIAIVMWLAVSMGFRVYLTYFNNYTLIYGSIGAVIILLLWFYFLGISLLFGAAVNCEVEKAVGLISGDASRRQSELDML
jgi:membrane protein